MPTGRFEVTSKKIFGGEQSSHRQVLRLPDERGRHENKDTVVRRDRVHVAAASSASRSPSGSRAERWVS